MQSYKCKLDIYMLTDTILNRIQQYSLTHHIKWIYFNFHVTFSEGNKYFATFWIDKLPGSLYKPKLI